MDFFVSVWVLVPLLALWGLVVGLVVVSVRRRRSANPAPASTVAPSAAESATVVVPDDVSSTAADADRPAQARVPEQAEPPAAEAPPEPAEPAVAEAPPAGDEPAPPEPADDFRKIEGIGPKMAGALQAAGIRTYRQLADCDEAVLRDAVRGAGMRATASLPTWPERARVLAGGDG